MEKFATFLRNDRFPFDLQLACEMPLIKKENETSPPPAKQL